MIQAPGVRPKPITQDPRKFDIKIKVHFDIYTST